MRRMLCADLKRERKTDEQDDKKKTGEVSSDGSGPLPFHFTILSANSQLATVRS